MEPDYLHLIPDHSPPSLTYGPFLAILVAETPVLDAWRIEVSEWLITSGCHYCVAWGVGCEVWHDSVDWANLKRHDFGDIPDDQFVMTTWHDKDPLSEAMWFAGNCTSHPTIELKDAVILHVAQHEDRARILHAFHSAQETTNT